MTHSRTAPEHPGGPALARLGALVGIWRTEGRTIGTPTEPAITIEGTDAYEWVAGGRFLLHRVDVRMGEVAVEAVEIIGYDETTGTYPTHAFDNSGTVATYHFTERDGVWTIAGDGERSTLEVDPAGDSMRARWERARDGSTWEPWMDMRFTRMAACGG